MGMPKITTQKLVKGLLRMGFVEKDRMNSHIKLYDPIDPSRFAALPNHKGQEISCGSLRNILKSLRVEVEELKRYI